jgi:hypothetical protein
MFLIDLYERAHEIFIYELTKILCLDLFLANTPLHNEYSSEVDRPQSTSSCLAAILI